MMTATDTRWHNLVRNDGRRLASTRCGNGVVAAALAGNFGEQWQRWHQQRKRQRRQRGNSNSNGLPRASSLPIDAAANERCCFGCCAHGHSTFLRGGVNTASACHSRHNRLPLKTQPITHLPTRQRIPTTHGNSPSCPQQTPLHWLRTLPPPTRRPTTISNLSANNTTPTTTAPTLSAARRGHKKPSQRVQRVCGTRRHLSRTHLLAFAPPNLQADLVPRN